MLPLRTKTPTSLSIFRPEPQKVAIFIEGIKFSWNLLSLSLTHSLSFLDHLSLCSATLTMALRPIDNALPTTTPERPKKQPKIAVATQKQQDRAAAVNGENQVPLPSSGDATVDYVSSDNLKPLSDPEVQIQVCVCCSPFFLSLCD